MSIVISRDQLTSGAKGDGFAANLNRIGHIDLLEPKPIVRHRVACETNGPEDATRSLPILNGDGDRDRSSWFDPIGNFVTRWGVKGGHSRGRIPSLPDELTVDIGQIVIIDSAKRKVGLLCFPVTRNANLESIPGPTIERFESLGIPRLTDSDLFPTTIIKLGTRPTF